ncbi:MAG: hypothetical protein KKA73_01525 [Chloroflexi bacterium]|nr:hypothetical protein [Chloroflexota bacterium]MBU1746344.1 hypothetical protein [Chloroflexota bacterium]
MRSEHLELNNLEWFIRLGRLVGLKQSSWSEVRARQDAALTERVRQQSLARIGDPRLIQVTDDSFFLGTVDYMVRNAPQGRASYAVLEANGGSSRGLTLLAPPDVERLVGAFVEMLRFMDAQEPPLILIGHLDEDALITERLLIAYRLKEALELERPGHKVRLVSLDEFRTLHRDWGKEATIVLGPYSQTIPDLHVQDDRVYLLDRRVHLIVGDGVARRHPQLVRQRADVVLANWVFPITSDKSATYETVLQAQSLLAPCGVHPLRFWQAWDQDELEQICEERCVEMGGLVIKPCRGSGGTGVFPILAASTVSKVVADSLGEFYAQYGHEHNPFPYTICELIDPRKATWRGNRHSYDVSIYVARQGDTLIPAGCLFRLAPQPYLGSHTKASLIVSLTGYGGVAAERGLGLSQESLQIVHLEEEDVVRAFAAAVVLMAFIARQPPGYSVRV